MKKIIIIKVVQQPQKPLAGPIRFELRPQVRQIHPSDLQGHCIAAKTQLYVAAAGKTSQIVDRRPKF